MLFLEGIELGLEGGHFFGRFELGEGEGNQNSADKESQEDNGKTQVATSDLVQPKESAEDGLINISVIHKFKARGHNHHVTMGDILTVFAQIAKHP